MQALGKGLQWLRRIVAGLTGTLLLWMVVLSLIQLLLRWFTDTSLAWADLQLRQLVLWIGLLGGVLAASEGRHIRIDLVEQFFKGKIQTVVEKFVSLVAALIMFYLTNLSYHFLIEERKADTVLDRVLFGYSAPIWIVEAIIPVCFALMGIYFLSDVILKKDRLAKRGLPL